MGRTGLEQPQCLPGKVRVATQSGAESGALFPDWAAHDPELAAVCDAWPGLPEAVRAKIVATVRDALDGRANLDERP